VALGKLDRLLLPVGCQLAALPFCVLLASAPSLEASANPLGGNVVAGLAGAEISIVASGGAHIADVGARQPNITNIRMPAGDAETTITAEVAPDEPVFRLYAGAGSEPMLSAAVIDTGILTAEHEVGTLGEEHPTTIRLEERRIEDIQQTDDRIIGQSGSSVDYYGDPF
jgi:hypothetical protein